MTSWRTWSTAPTPSAHDPRVKAVVSQVGAMDVGRTVCEQIGAERVAALQQMTVQERIRHAEEGGHYSVYRGQGADEAGRAAADWFSEHLAH